MKKIYIYFEQKASPGRGGAVEGQEWQRWDAYSL